MPSVLSEVAAVSSTETTAAVATNAARTSIMSNLAAKATQVGRFLPASASMSVTQEVSNHWLNNSSGILLIALKIY